MRLCCKSISSIVRQNVWKDEIKDIIKIILLSQRDQFHRQALHMLNIYVERQNHGHHQHNPPQPERPFLHAGPAPPQREEDLHPIQFNMAVHQQVINFQHDLQQEEDHQAEIQRQEEEEQQLQHLRQNQENHAQQQLDEQEQQQLISQALEEFCRLFAEHHDQDEHCQQQAAQENPEADIDDHEDDHSQRPPQHPPDGNRGGGGGGDPDPGLNQPNPPQLCLPEGGRPYTEPVEPHSLGHMDVECHHCRALHFMTEKLSNSSARNSCFGLCCLQGQVSLPLCHIHTFPSCNSSLTLACLTSP